MEKLKALGRMLVIVPHQDDEVLLAGGIIASAAGQGLPIHVCMVTNGDYGCADHTIGHLRLRESLNALEYLGLREEHVTFLGYADTGMPESESFLCRLRAAGRNELVPSLCGRETYALPGKPTWHFLQTGAEAPYCRESLENDLDALLNVRKPDTVLTTSTQDTHGDHSALCRFVREAAARQGRPIRILEGVAHSLAGDEHWPPRESGELPLPEGMEDYAPIRFALPQAFEDPDFAESRKLHALRMHVTAMKPDAVDFLTSFVKRDEVFFERKRGNGTHA